MIKPPTTRLLDSPAGREVLDRLASMGLLDRNSVVAAVTSAADADSAKPDPGIIRVALA